MKDGDSFQRDNFKKRGFTLIEVITSISIILIFTGIIGVGYGNIREEISLREANAKILGTMKRYRERAFYEDKSYGIVIDTARGEITIMRGGLDFVERVKLPETLRYRIPMNEGTVAILNADMTSNGNMSKAFSIYLFGKSDVARYRISFYTFSELKYLSINLYRNISAESANYSKILEYHKTYAAQNHIGWEKQ